MYCNAVVTSGISDGRRIRLVRHLFSWYRWKRWYYSVQGQRSCLHCKCSHLLIMQLNSAVRLPHETVFSSALQLQLMLNSPEKDGSSSGACLPQDLITDPLYYSYRYLDSLIPKKTSYQAYQLGTVPDQTTHADTPGIIWIQFNLDRSEQKTAKQMSLWYWSVADPIPFVPRSPLYLNTYLTYRHYSTKSS